LERWVGGLARVARIAGHEVRVVTLDRRPTDDAPLVAVDGEDVVRLQRRGPRRYPLAAGLREACSGVDLVHVFAVDGLLDGLLWRRPAPVGVSTAGLFHHNGGGVVQDLVLRWWTRRQLRRADAVWFTSSVDADRLPGIAGRVLAPGLDLRPLLDMARRPEPGRWLVPGRIDRHKGHAALFRAVALMRRQPLLRIVGAGATGELRSLARALGNRVLWLGEVDDAAWAEELSRAAVAVFPSRFESFGMATVEAMAAGVPVVVHPGGALRERVVDEVDGRVVDFSDPHAAAAVLDVDVPEALGRAARRSAAAFDWSVRLADHEAAWKEMMT
jgi:glycosyltransferase involved in cell wall biosynthesis